MKYLDLIKHFWEENRSERFSLSESVLYLYLLNEANRKFWKMPFSCSTAIIVAETGLNKSTLIRAREGLKERRLISFTEGVQNSRAPTYVITNADTTSETAYKTCEVTDSKTAATTAYDSIDKDKDINKEKMEGKKGMLSIAEIEKRMLEDINWQKLVLSQLKQMGYAPPKDNNLIPYIKQFFAFQKISNINQREEGDCRQHFFNKLKKEYLTKNNYGSNQFERNNRRGSLEVAPTSKENYEAAF